MKKNYTLASIAALGLMFLTLQTFALDYTITFTGSGLSTTVGSVEVQNVTRGTSVTVAGGSVLTLNVSLTGLNPSGASKEGLRISAAEGGKSNVLFFAKQAGSTQINAYGMNGRMILGTSKNLQQGENSFQLSLPTGVYVIQVQGKGFSYSAKTISISSNQSRPDIAFLGNAEEGSAGSFKSVSAPQVAMQYFPGDWLRYKGISGNWATVVPDKPTASKTVNFVFVECKDASLNYYATVKIGNQTWMAENMRTTKYRGGVTIPNLTLPADWGNTALVTGAWCYLDNNAANDTKFGKIYNWFAVADARNIAPTGWHVPTVAEYRTLATFLGDSLESGGKLKETGITNWQTSVEGTSNETGFSARGSAKCNSGGVMNDYDYGYLWTASEFTATNATCVYMTGGSLALTMTYSPGKRNGFALRCVKD